MRIRVIALLLILATLAVAPAALAADDKEPNALEAAATFVLELFGLADGGGQNEAGGLPNPSG